MSLEAIINGVKRTPELWDAEYHSYKNKKNIKKFWSHLAAELRCPEEHVKKRWKHLKDQYRKELKKIIAQNNGVLPPEGECSSVWQWFDSLSFMKAEILNKAEAPRKSMKKEESSTDDEDQPIKKRKTDFDISRQEEEHHTSQGELATMDPDYMFLMSLLPTMKSLNDIQKLQLRGKINEWLLQAITQNQDETFDTKFHLGQHLSH